MAPTPEQQVYMLKDKLRDASQALEDETRRKTELQTKTDQLTAEIRRNNEAYAKLDKHAKNCEKATGKAQKEIKHAKGYADHLISSQKGNLRSAERRAADATRELKEWRVKYGESVEGPAEEKEALHTRISQWQSKAQKAENQITLLEAQIQGTPDQIGLHQALEQWEEHQGCSVEVRDLEDLVHDGKLVKEKLESDLVSIKERYQRAKSDVSALRSKVDALEQANKALRRLQVTADQPEEASKDNQELQVKADLLEQANKALQELRIKVEQLEQANKSLQDQDKTHHYVQHIQKLESDLKASTEQYQIAEGDLKAFQEKVNEVFRYQGEANVDMLDEDKLNKETLESYLKAFREQHQKLESDKRELQDKAEQLEQANKALLDQEKSHNDMLQKLESDQRASEERFQELESNNNALQERADQLESDLTATGEQYDITKYNMQALQGEADQLEVDLTTARAQHQATKSNMEALQEKADQLEQANKTCQDKADQLESDVQSVKAQYQSTKSNMEALQVKADGLEQANKTSQENAEQLESDLQSAKEQYQSTKSNMEALQVKADGLEQANKTSQENAEQLESDLQSAKEQHQSTKLNMEALQVKADQLEEANKTSQEKVAKLESDLDITIEAHELAESFSEAMEREVASLKSDLTTAEERYQTAKSDLDEIRDQVMQNSAKLLAGEDQTNTFGLDDTMYNGLSDSLQRKLWERRNLRLQQDSKMRIETPEEAESSQATQPSSPTYTTDDGSLDLEKTPRSKKSLRSDLGYSSRDQSDEEQSDFWMPQQQGAMPSKQAGEESCETDDGEDAEEHADGSTHREMKKPLSQERQAKNLETFEIRAKEQPEALEALFECTPAKAHAIDRRLKALGPGCRLHEAPALVAYELSGIPEDTYKGVASGQLIATLPPNEVKDEGTSPAILADNVAADTTGLPATEVAAPVYLATDMATDTRDLPVEKVKALYNSLSRRALISYFLMSLMIFFGLFCFYMRLKSDPKFEAQEGILYKNMYSHRHTPLPTPSLNASTPITIVFPPTPAPQLGLARMMNGSSLVGGLGGRTW